MEKLQTMTAVLLEWPSNLKSVEDVSKETGISADRLLSLADAGFAPHYRIDGKEALFKTSEIRKWGARNIL